MSMNKPITVFLFAIVLSASTIYAQKKKGMSGVSMQRWAE